MEAKTNENTNIIPETGTCCLCGGNYEMYGNNPFPLSLDENDRCCGKCNWEKVIPARILYDQFMEDLVDRFKG